MGNLDWHVRFPRATLHNLVSLMSDHNVILLDTETTLRRVYGTGFRFENR